MYNRPFNWWVQSVMPLVFDDSLSYYEVLAKLTKYIEGLTGDVEQIKNVLETIEGIEDITQFTEFLESIQRQIGNLDNLQTQTKASLVSAINEVALKADIAYWKPPTGIPESDLSQEVQNKLNKVIDTTEFIINNRTLKPAPNNNSPSDLGLGTYTVPPGGIPWATLSDDVKNRISHGGSGTTDYTELINKPQINGHTLNGGNNTNESLGIGSYSKPNSGIPESDLSAEVQHKLNTSGGIAGSENGFVATRNYEAGELVYINGQLYRVNYDILAGTNLIPGNNIEATDVNAELERINNDIEALQSGSGPDSWNLSTTVHSSNSLDIVDFFEYFNCIGGENYNFIVEPVDPSIADGYTLNICKRDGSIVKTEIVTSNIDYANRYRFTFTPTNSGEYFCKFHRYTNETNVSAYKVTIEYTQSQGISELWSKVNDSIAIGEDVDAIETLVSQHTVQIDKLEDAFSLEPVTLQYTLDGSGTVKHVDGTIGSSSISSHTDYVDVSDYPYLYYKQQASNANNPTAGMAFYDSNKAYICGESAVAGQSGGYMAGLKKIAVPSNAKYARFSTCTDQATYGAFEVYGESPIVDKINEGDNIIVSLLPESLPFSLISGQYIYSDGSITKAPGWYITDYIDVTGIDKIIYTRIATPENWAGYGIAWFDTNQELMPNTGTGSVQYADTYSYVLTIKDIPSGAKYVRMTVMDRNNLNLPFGVYDYAEYEKALAPNAKKYAPVVGSPRLYLANAPVDPDFDIRKSSSGGTSYTNIYSRYDALCALYPHWIRRETDIGRDSSDKPIARYTIRMYDPLVFLGDGARNPPFTNNIWETHTKYRRALLTAGVHGNERVGVMGLYYLIENILSSNDEWARFIKSNYILDIIPIINPDGFNANRRRNANNVDINRDYMKKTTEEAQVMTDFIQSIKDDLYCVMDFHGSYELGFLATPQNSYKIDKMMTIATQTISACADDWGDLESIIGNTPDYYPYAYGCLSVNTGTLPYYILMNNITPYVFTVESPCLLLDTTVRANSAKIVAAAKMAMDQGCNILQALLSI